MAETTYLLVRALFRLISPLHIYPFAVDLVVAVAHDRVEARRVTHRNETEAAAVSGLAIPHDDAVSDRAEALPVGAKRLVVHVRIQPAHEALPGRVPRPTTAPAAPVVSVGRWRRRGRIVPRVLLRRIRGNLRS